MNDMQNKKKGRGFQNMSPQDRSEAARKGGIAAHKKGTAHEWRSSEEAAAAGRLGGRSRSNNNQNDDSDFDEE